MPRPREGDILPGVEPGSLGGVRNTPYQRRESTVVPRKTFKKLPLKSVTYKNRSGTKISTLDGLNQFKPMDGVFFELWVKTQN